MALKQVWDVNTEPVMVMLEKLSKDIRGNLGEKAVKAGGELAQEKMRPFFDEGGDHNLTGATQDAFIEKLEIVNLADAGRGIYTFVGYKRYERGKTGYVSSYFERGTPRKGAEKRVPKYSFMSKIAKNKAISKAMMDAIKEGLKEYGG